jgi:phenylalanine-4-hydroxylase
MDYLQEPDIFHDVFGHVPLLANPVYADFMEAYGKGGQRAMALGQLKNLARLYWYTIEFGLMKSADGLRIFGAVSCHRQRSRSSRWKTPRPTASPSISNG